MKAKVQKYIDIVTNHPLLASFLHWAKTTSFIGFRGASLYDVARFFIKEMRRDAIAVRASAISFNFLLAFFPSLIFLFTLIPYLPLDNFETQLFIFLEDFLPKQAFTIIEETIHDCNQPREGLLSIGAFLTIYFASNALMSLLLVFDKSYHSAFQRRNLFQLRGAAIQLALILIVLTLAGGTLLLCGGVLVEWLHGRVDISFNILKIARWIITIMIVYVAIVIIYMHGVKASFKMPFFTPGAIAATILSLVTSAGFSFYVNNFGQFNKIYGSIGTVIVIFIWLKLNASLCIIGYELNVSILMNQGKGEKQNIYLE